MIKKKEKKPLEEEIIEETDESRKICRMKTSELIKIIKENYKGSGKYEYNDVVDLLEYNSFGINHGIPKIICEKIKIKNSIFRHQIFYDNIKLLPIPATVNFIDTNGDSYAYKIYNINYVQKIIQKLHFQNSVIVNGNKEYPLSSLKNLFYNLDSNLVIQNKEIIIYENIFSQKNIQQTNTCKTGLDLTPNFKYYFKYPNPEEEFIPISSDYRDIFFDKEYEKKIIGLCGPMGIGKSTTLLILLRIKINEINYCYLNIKALKDNEDNIFIWKEKLFLTEIAYALRNKYKFEIFEELKKKIDEVTFFWEAIKTTIQFFIEKKVQINFILDQYQEKNDPNYKYINEIKKILDNDINNVLYIIVSSSINDKDVRDSLLLQILKENTKPNIVYEYLKKLIDISKNIENDSKLTEKQKDMIIKDFNSIPKFYYAIRTITEESELNEYKILQIEKIKSSIEEFFNVDKNVLDREKIETLINLRGSFGYNLQKNDFIKLLKILPFKYFTFDLDKNIINFSFPLVEDVFDNFFSNIICNFLKSPISSFKNGTIGDILELNLLTDLSTKKFWNIENTIIVDSIWEISDVKITETKSNFKLILFMQDNEKAKFIDFAILSNNEDLLLFQCKKALKTIPENYITRKIVEKNKLYIYTQFNEYFRVKLKRIFLYYITGITFFKKDNEIEYRTWGANKEENFDNIQEIAKNAEADLFYYEVTKRKIYFENNKKFEVINNIIDYSNKISSPILIDLKINSDNKNANNNNGINNSNNNFIIVKREFCEDYSEFTRKLFVEEKFFTQSQIAYLKKNNPDIINNTIIACIKNPIARDISNKRMIGLKRKNKNYLLIFQVSFRVYTSFRGERF